MAVTADENGRPVLRFTGPALPDTRPEERLSRILRGLDRIAAEHEGPVVVVSRRDG